MLFTWARGVAAASMSISAAVASFSSPPLFPLLHFPSPRPCTFRRTAISSDKKDRGRSPSNQGATWLVYFSTLCQRKLSCPKNIRQYDVQQIRPAPKKMNQAKKKHWTSNHRKRGIYGHQLQSITRCLILELPRKAPQSVSFQPLHDEAQAQAQSNGSKVRPWFLVSVTARDKAAAPGQGPVLVCKNKAVQ